MSLLPVLAVDFGIQALSYAIAAPLQTEKFYDLSGAATYAFCVGASLYFGRRAAFWKAPSISSFFQSQLHPRQLIVSMTTLAWCTRLGSFLAYRVHQRGKDDRFDKIKKNPVRFGFAWFMQAVWVFTTAFPVYLINVLPAASLARLGWLDYLGLSVWAAGFITEVLADSQKLSWQKRLGNEESRRQFIQEGLWSWSRHPNYFGECLLWTGNWIICSSAFRHLGLLSTIKYTSLFAISPLFVFGLIYRLSGVPLLEKKADERFGTDPEYIRYKSSVPEFFPRIPFFSSKPSSKAD